MSAGHGGAQIGASSPRSSHGQVRLLVPPLTCASLRDASVTSALRSVHLSLELHTYFLPAVSPSRLCASCLTPGPSLIPRSPPGSHQLQPPVALTDDNGWHLPASQRCWGHELPLPTTAALPWCLLSASLIQLLHPCFLGAPK